MILYTPLDIPRIVPNDWNSWWHVWDEHKADVVKYKMNHNGAQDITWQGFDIYNEGGKERGVVYDAPLIPSYPVTDDLVNQVMQHCPIQPYVIRIMENIRPVGFHSDNTFVSHEFRSFLWSDYTDPLWAFEYEGVAKRARMPVETNSFYFRDYPLKHAAIHREGHTKGLLVIYGKPKDTFDQTLERSAEKYKDYAWIV